MKRSEKKRKQKKVVLMFTLATAAVIVGGMTFAWFSSKDEVTNRFSAQANFGASIVEDFVPEEEWLPGQEVNKDVAVVNTGSVDAFVRTWLEGNLRVIEQVTGANELKDFTSGANSTASALTTQYKDLDKTTTLGKLHLIPTASNTTTYYKLLNDYDATDNPSNPAGSAVLPSTDDTAYTEVQSLQAGGWLAYCNSSAQWQYTTKADENAPSSSVVETVQAVSGSSGTLSVPDTATANYVKYAPGTKGLAIDSESFKPITSGIYVFARNRNLTDTEMSEGYEYSGYYYVAKTNTPGDGYYYALETKNDSTVMVESTSTTGTNVYLKGIATSPADPRSLTDDNISGVKLFLANSTLTENSGLTWAFDGTNKKLTVSRTADTAANKISIDVQLDSGNIITTGTGAQKWFYKATAGTPDTNHTFYYTDDLESGDTTAKLVDSVKLSENVTAASYLAFDFDLNVKMDSVQVTKDQSGKETYDTVDADWTATTGDAVTAAKVTAATYDGTEIATLTWE